MWFQHYSDRFLERTLLWLIPNSITPNQVSTVRILSVPFIYYFLSTESYTIGFILFAIAALTDALDGAMARTRDQVTATGEILDAVADRSLIAIVAIVFIPELYGWTLLFVLAALEVANAGMAWRSRRALGHNPGANWAGKVKMIIQCIAFLFILLAYASGTMTLLTLAYYLLIVSLMFALLQCFYYPQKPLEAIT